MSTESTPEQVLQRLPDAHRIAALENLDEIQQAYRTGGEQSAIEASQRFLDTLNARVMTWQPLPPDSIHRTTPEQWEELRQLFERAKAMAAEDPSEQATDETSGSPVTAPSDRAEKE